MFTLASKKTKIIGAIAEHQALEYLTTQGLKLIIKNFSIKTGEVDLIMKNNNNNIIFVEVRYRNNTQFCTPEETVTKHKQHKIRNTALYYISKNKMYSSFQIRFDVVAMTLVNNKLSINWIQNAF